MELLVVGLGSMGKRRARLIRGVEPSAALAGVDFAPARREEARAEAKTEAKTKAKTKTGSETGLEAGTEAEARENAPELAK